jgi:protein TonB
MSYTFRKSASQRYSGLFGVVILHVVVVYLLASGLGKSVMHVITKPVETKVIEEAQDKPEEPPPPPPKLEAPPPEFVPPPEIAVASDPAPATTAIRQVQNKVAVKPAPPPPVAVVPPRVNPRRPNGLPPYPPTSRRLGEQGVVTLQLYIDERGRVVDAKVEKSSGFPRLDEAAVKEAKRNWRFIPAKRGSETVPMWMSLNVRFKLT